jgi:hypothetical protein
LKQVADLEVLWEPSVIFRRDRLRTITISAYLDEGLTAAEVVAQLEPRLAEASQDWSLGTLYEYGGETEVETDATLTTNGSFSYYDASHILQSVNGIAMDYATGDALLVGQVLLTEGDFAGYRATFAINGNDPVLVPEPSTVLLISIGLAGLTVAGRRRTLDP